MCHRRFLLPIKHFAIHKQISSMKFMLVHRLVYRDNGKEHILKRTDCMTAQPSLYLYQKATLAHNIIFLLYIWYARRPPPSFNFMLLVFLYSCVWNPPSLCHHIYTSNIAIVIYVVCLFDNSTAFYFSWTKVLVLIKQTVFC